LKDCFFFTLITLNRWYLNSFVCCFTVYNFNCEYICCSCQALRSLQKDSITAATRGEGPSKCLAVEKQSIKIVANKIGNKQKCALSKTTNELIDTNDHGDECLTATADVLTIKVVFNFLYGLYI
jgi:hypothetical protein